MLQQLHLQWFKCFELLRLPLSPLTLLSGSNASGKSSVLQALALLQQTMREHEWSTRLMLNGSTVRLGTVADVIDKVNGRNDVTIGVDDSDTPYEWTFTGDRSELSMAIGMVRAGGERNAAPKALRYMLPYESGTEPPGAAKRLRGLTYITAERVGPREVYELEDRQGADVVGPAGEHAVSVLSWGRDEAVLPALALRDVPPTRLRQVEARMASFFPGCSLGLQQIPQANAVTLGIRTSDDTDFHRPMNVGFGLTQVLPIIVAAMSAAQGDVLLIENPEVHLHPAGQTHMGKFLAEVAANGVQVLVETHSDHLLNGIRRAVKDGTISAESTSLHFFRPRSLSGAQVLSPQIDSAGNIDSWPEGFFDQFDKDSSYFAGWGN